MRYAARLEKISNAFFLSGFFISKAQHIPIPIVSSIINLISLVMYFLGYLLWYLGSFIFPNRQRSEDQWYGFAQFREQYKLAAIIGLIATALSIVAIMIPIFILPASWLFLISNAIWTVSEYHKLKNPALYEPNVSVSQQDAYVSYAITMSVISLLTALSTSLILLFPALALPIFFGATLIGVGMGVLAFEFWLKHLEQDTPNIDQGYEAMSSLNLNNLPLDTSSLKPHHTKSLFQPNVLIELNSNSCELSCNSAL